MATIIRQKRFRKLDFDTTYEIKVRVKWGDLIGEWSDPPLTYTTIGTDTIPGPSNPAMDFKQEEDKKWSCIARCDELVLANCVEAADEYIFQIWKWDRKTNSLKEDTFFLKTRVKAKDEDQNDFAKAKFHPIPKKSWYVMRVRAVVDGVKGQWSDWTSPGSPQDNVGPSTPQAVAIHRAVNGIRFTWNVPSEFNIINGTVTGGSGSTTLTGTGTAFRHEVGVGSIIRVDSEQRNVLVIASPTSLTVDVAWGTNHTDAYCEVDQTEDDISHAEAQLFEEDPANPDTFDFNNNFLVDKDRRIFQQKIRLQAEGDSKYYGRVRLVDSSGVKSDWIPATRLGNSNPDATPETRKPKNLEAIATFSVSGSLSVKNYKHRWYARHDYNFKNVFISAGDAPSGGQVKVQVYKNTTEIFSTPNRPTIPAGDHKDVKRAFTIDAMDDGDYLTIGVDEASGAADLVVNVAMERDN